VVPVFVPAKISVFGLSSWLISTTTRPYVSFETCNYYRSHKYIEIQFDSNWRFFLRPYRVIKNLHTYVYIHTYMLYEYRKLTACKGMLCSDTNQRERLLGTLASKHIHTTYVCILPMPTFPDRPILYMWSESQQLQTNGDADERALKKKGNENSIFEEFSFA
jgi:hypothetical protein